MPGRRPPLPKLSTGFKSIGEGARSIEYLTLGRIKTLMAGAGRHPDHGLGQNFLVNIGVVEAIVSAAGDAEVAVEVGAGPGVLTLPLSYRYPRVVAVEIDEHMVTILEDVLAHRPGVSVLTADAREVDWRRELDRLGIGVPVVWFGNLPYYAAAPILNRVLESGVPWTRGIFMLQREVAARLSSEPGTKDYGILTLAVRYHAEVRVLRRVRPGSFYPAPEVSSSVVELTPRDAAPEVPKGTFMRVVRAGFGQRRKTLRNTLSGSEDLGLDRDSVEALLETADVNPGARAETLSMEQFEAIARALGEIQAPSTPE